MKRVVLSLVVSSLLALAQQPAILHKANPKYPPIARLQRIEGLVVIAVDVDDRGLVTDARTLSGPIELRGAALRAALDWQYAATGKSFQTTIDFNFSLLRDAASAADRGKLKSIEFSGVAPQLEALVRARIPLKPDDPIPAGAEGAIQQLVAETDPKLAAYLTEDHRLIVETRPPSIRVGGNVQASKLEYSPRPQYPPEAKAARIQGAVRLDALIDKRGNIARLDVDSGHPQLVEAALTAVRQWRYQTTLLNGNPVEVMTKIDVNFTLLP